MKNKTPRDKCLWEYELKTGMCDHGLMNIGVSLTHLTVLKVS